MHFCPKNDILKSEKSPRKEAAMPTLTDPAVIKELLQRHGFSFSRFKSSQLRVSNTIERLLNIVG